LDLIFEDRISGYDKPVLPPRQNLMEMEVIDLPVVEMLAAEVILVIPNPLALVTISPPRFLILVNFWAEENLDRQILRNDGMMNKLKL